MNHESKNVTPIEENRRVYREVKSARLQRGNSLTEYMVYAVVVAIAVSIMLLMYVRSSGAQSGNTLVSEFTDLAANSSNTYSGQWSQFTTANAEKSGLFHNYSIITDSGSGTISLKQAGTLSVAPGQLVSSNDSGAFTLTGLPEGMCKKFVTGIGASAGSMTLNSTTVKTYGGTLDPTASCNTSSNTIVVTEQ